MREVYLDNNATTPMAPEAVEAMLPYYAEHFGNPGSAHVLGASAERALKDARQRITGAIGASPHELIFTSGATEADNLALRGLVHANQKRGTHIVSSLVEHDAVLGTLAALEMEGYRVTYLMPGEGGAITSHQVADAVGEDTVLVALMHVNNETGAVTDIEACGRAAKRVNPHTLLFVDGVQAFGKRSISLDHVDAYAISAHKIHGPKGVGALYVRDGISLESQLTGGGQEGDRRSGTQNIPGIVGFSRATELAQSGLEQNSSSMRARRDELIAGIRDIDDTYVISPADGLESTVNAAFPGVPAEVLLHALEERGIYVSTGSACGSSGSVSHVLEALELPERVAQSAIRFGLSRYTSEDDIAYTIEQLQDIVPEMRQVMDDR
jgi:cysteine desulfurase